MKKILFVVIGALLFLPVLVHGADQPFEIKGFRMESMSSDGNWLFGREVKTNYPATYNISSNQLYKFSIDSYARFGDGQLISKNGIAIVTASTYDTDYSDCPFILIPGEDKARYLTQFDYENYWIVNAISDEGNRFCGFAAYDSFPFYCDIAEGVAGDPVKLPVPEKDLFGMKPQNVKPIAMNQDGSVILGAVNNSYGNYVYPIVYQETSENGWEYYYPAISLFNSEIELPESPGEFDEMMPAAYEYMTEEEIEEFNQAVDDYFNDRRDSWPDYEEFMTDEERTDYREAMDKYYSAYEIWEEKDTVFRAAMQQVLDTSVNFSDHYMAMDSEGMFMAFTSSRMIEDPTAWFPEFEYNVWVLDVASGELKELESVNKKTVVSQVLSNGTVLSYTPREPALSYICPSDSETFLTFQNYLISKNTEYADWMTENLTQKLEEYDNDLEEWIINDVVVSGKVLMNSDLSMFAGGLNMDNDSLLTYIFSDFNGESDAGINNPDSTGNLQNIEYYTLQGVKVNNPQKGQLLIIKRGDKSEKIFVR